VNSERRTIQNHLESEVTNKIMSSMDGAHNGLFADVAALLAITSYSFNERYA
jgi:hypothetical protein